MSKTCKKCGYEYKGDVCNLCAEYPPIPVNATCEYCDNTAEYWGGDNWLCEEHHDQYVDGYRERD